MSESRIRAPYDVLCRVIGNPMHRPKPEERVAWEVDVDGAKARIHAHLDDRPVGWATNNIFDAPQAVWRVEAENDEALAWVCTQIAERVIAEVAKQSGPRKLTDDDKKAVNMLLKSGMSLSAAMKQVQTQTDDTEARRSYGWPLKEPAAAATVAAARGDDGDDDDDDDDEESGPVAPAKPAKPAKPAASSTAPSRPKATPPPSKPALAVGPPIARDVPRGSVEAPFAKMRAVLGEPEDRPVPFVSTRWRFVLNGDRVARWEDEPSDDPRDVDASVFDRLSRFDKPYLAREAATATWTVTSSTAEHLEAVLAWLEDRLKVSE